nr:glutathione S-transferase epsilon 4 [Ectropis grisescens]
MTLRLYKADFSPPARAVMMLFDILELPFETVEVNLRKKEHLTAEFLKLNPVHTIPVLEDGDLVLQDSHAILMYIVDKYANNDGLYPKDAAKRALVNQKLFFDSWVLNMRLKVIAQGAFYFGQKTVTDKQRNDVLDAYGFLEEFLSKSKFIAGDQLTIADLSAFTYVSSVHYLVPIDPVQYPLTVAWMKYLEKQPYAQKYNTAGARELYESIKTFQENN